MLGLPGRLFARLKKLRKAPGCDPAVAAVVHVLRTREGHALKRRAARVPRLR